MSSKQVPTPFSSGGSSAVSSVFGRTGAVVATTGDYTPTKVGFSAYPLVPGTDVTSVLPPYKYRIVKSGSNYVAYNTLGVGVYTSTDAGVTITDAFDGNGVTCILDGIGGSFVEATLPSILYNQCTLIGINGATLIGANTAGSGCLVAGNGTTTVDQVTIDGIVVDGGSYAIVFYGIALRNATRSKIRNCIGQNFAGTSNSMIFIIGGYPGGTLASEIADQCTIENCITYDCFESFVIGAFSAPAGTWTNNTISHCKAKYVTNNRVNWGVAVQFGALDSTVDNCIIDDAGVSAMLVRNAVGTTISGGIIDMPNGATVGSGYGIRIDQESKETIVNGVIIRNQQQDGIVIFGALKTTLANCIFHNNGQETATTYYDIELQGQNATTLIVKDTLISECQFFEDASNKVAYNIAETGTSTYQVNTIVHGGKTDGNAATGPLLFAGLNGQRVKAFQGYLPAQFSATLEGTGTAFTLLAYDAVYIITTATGLTGLTLNGTAVSFAAGIPIYVPAGLALTPTYSGTPVFEVQPITQ